MGVSILMESQSYWGNQSFRRTSPTRSRSLDFLGAFLIEDESEVPNESAIVPPQRQGRSIQSIHDGCAKKYSRKHRCSRIVSGMADSAVGFDADFYPTTQLKPRALTSAAAAKSALQGWLKNIKNRLTIEKLDNIRIEFFSSPFPPLSGSERSSRRRSGSHDTRRTQSFLAGRGNQG